MQPVAVFVGMTEGLAQPVGWERVAKGLVSVCTAVPLWMRLCGECVVDARVGVITEDVGRGVGTSGNGALSSQSQESSSHIRLCTSSTGRLTWSGCVAGVSDMISA